MNKNVTYYCGYVTIIGRPNVGKSSLLNQILGYKLSITSRKLQTTRYRILGIKTFKNIQILYVDTPGLHFDTSRMINRYMNRIAWEAFQKVNLILFVIEPHWDEHDTWVLKQIQNIEIPVFLIINKIDQIKLHSKLLPLIKKVSSFYTFKEIIPFSAKTGDHIEILEQKINDQIPESCFHFPPQQVTDASDQFLAAEIIREKLMRSLGQEIPYSLAVRLVMFQREKKIIRISAVIWIERKGQKRIVIGKNGERLKKIGTIMRIDMEKLFNQKVFLQLFSFSMKLKKYS
ncbi:GTP-binding protein Era [Coxiella-like endosymbiont]|uniref:GTPase Era n=1 Tax=Coxiella endosymbiont of Rhipicephalus microplus TaxID=1656186 RepID=UPI000C80E7DD|nr:GTP-binding protein Era [Coxiella-like endosymbiont]